MDIAKSMPISNIASIVVSPFVTNVRKNGEEFTIVRIAITFLTISNIPVMKGR